MTDPTRIDFVRQQGFRDASPPVCAARYPALMLQPRLIGLLLLAGILLQEAWFFLGLGALLAWCALAPRLNPFDLLYNAFASRRGDSAKLPPAPGPRRFAQGLAAALMLVIAVALLSDRRWLAWGVEAFLAAAVSALVFGKFCLGSFLFLHLRGDGGFARRTAPWARGRSGFRG